MEQQRPNYRRGPAADEEAKVWASFYRNVSDPDLAAELIAHLDKDADSRSKYPGLYLRCKQSLRRERARRARARRYGDALRLALRFAILVPAHRVARALLWPLSALRFGRDVALTLCDIASPTASRAFKIPAANRAPAARDGDGATGVPAADSEPRPAPAGVPKTA